MWDELQRNRGTIHEVGEPVRRAKSRGMAAAGRWVAGASSHLVGLGGGGGLGRWGEGAHDEPPTAGQRGGDGRKRNRREGQKLG
jgi:hypothetical protein